MSHEFADAVRRERRKELSIDTAGYRLGQRKRRTTLRGDRQRIGSGGCIGRLIWLQSLGPRYPPLRPVVPSQLPRRS
jgi:hypothetical protein